MKRTLLPGAAAWTLASHAFRFAHGCSLRMTHFGPDSSRGTSQHLHSSVKSTCAEKLTFRALAFKYREPHPRVTEPIPAHLEPTFLLRLLWVPFLPPAIGFQFFVHGGKFL